MTKKHKNNYGVNCHRTRSCQNAALWIVLTKGSVAKQKWGATLLYHDDLLIATFSSVVDRMGCKIVHNGIEIFLISDFYCAWYPRGATGAARAPKPGKTPKWRRAAAAPPPSIFQNRGKT